MADKVYGFCGTNKCKREVVANGSFVEITGSKTLAANQSAMIESLRGGPEGNVYPISVLWSTDNEQWSTPEYGSNASAISPRIWFNPTDKSYGINIENNSTSQRTIYYKVLFLELPS